MFGNGYRDHKPETGNNKFNKAFVFLHGFGSNSHDLIELSSYFSIEFPNSYFISPNAMEKHSPYGYQWFDLSSRDINHMQSGITKVRPLVINAIKDKIDELSMLPKDLFLIGFSQGAMVAIDAALHMETSIGGVVSFSGAAIPCKGAKLGKTPICFIHGEEDEVVTTSQMMKSMKMLKEEGFKVSYHLIPNLSHSIDLKGIEHAIEFIKCV